LLANSKYRIHEGSNYGLRITNFDFFEAEEVTISFSQPS